MENASKALIIAGAIILSILIIGIGMFIYQQAAGTIQNTGLDQQEIEQFNSQFLQYEGTIKGTQAIALCNLVNSHNLANTDDFSRQIRVVAEAVEAQADNDITEADATTPTTVKATLKSGYTYTTTFTYDTSSGLIFQIGIVRKTS